MLEIIDRHHSEVTKTNVGHALDKMQVSYNSDGHLVLRFYNEDNPAFGDKLIVLTAKASRNVIDFVQRLFPGQQIPF